MWDISIVRPGLRLQILLLLGGLLVVTFVPLYFAVATYTTYTLSQVRKDSARSLGRAIAGQIAEARANPTRDLDALLDAQVGERGVEALAVYDRSGRQIARRGLARAADQLPASLAETNREDVLTLTTSHGRAIATLVPDPGGAVIAVLRTDDQASGVAPLVRLMALYMALIALALLLLAYFALTRLIVRPLTAMSRGAERVAAGARRLDVPRAGARELLDLGTSLKTMTERLLREEEALRRKVDEVEQTTKQLKEAQDRLVRSERLASVGRLAAGLAHEVGNPISAIIGMQDLLLEAGLSEEEQRDFLTRMRGETERINRILRDLLQFARPAANQVKDAEEPGNVEAAIYDTVTLVSPQKAMKPIELEVDVYPDLPAVALGREQLVQILLNLLLNAADACEEEGKVTVRARPTDGGVAISVEDTGPGVAPEVQSRLFEPFVTTKDVGKGTGLGLAVCRGLVESAGGTIALDPEHAGGARFVIELPGAEQ